jgi:hypothetical protein
MKDLNLGSTWGSSTFIEVDADGSGTKQTLGSLVYYAFNAREGSFASGGENRTLRLDWKSSTGSTICGVSSAKSAGTIGRANDTKNCEVTYILRVRNFISGSDSHFHASIKPRGDGHGGSNECCLQVGGRMPYTQRGRHSELYSVEYTHPDYEYQNVTFVSPFSSSNFPLIQTNTWFGMKLVLYNVNNNQAVHAEMWIDDNPINSTQNGFNNNWRKLWVFEHSGSRAPTWAGPNCQARTNMASQVDVIAYNIHEIVPPTSQSSLMSAEELAEKAEYEENTGNVYPTYISQITETPITGDPNTFVPEEELGAQQQQQQMEGDIDSWRMAHGITTTSDINTEEGASSSEDSKEITAPTFVKIATSEQTEAPIEYIKIKKLEIAQEPIPQEVQTDDADEEIIITTPPPPPPTPDEADPITALTRVTKSIITKYNIVGRVTNSAILKYNIAGSGPQRVTKSMIVKYNIVGRTKRSTIINYNIGQRDEFEDVAFDTTNFE